MKLDFNHISCENTKYITITCEKPTYSLLNQENHKDLIKFEFAFIVLLQNFYYICLCIHDDILRY